ncbi:NAD(P)H-quinone oxidoreductase subunit M, chloroplastic [Iris pallida]|uniref:NAD(P)H-quinone oxidoreductase subunit M, chloroplastic n=3 Tax=Iris pallida TaxID=29817 RepID=A0AAX6DJV8_IRIPA|nr:NAD(P)H-quinone oxidoreductase subunit M, chloroplastic [Iris pallida]
MASANSFLAQTGFSTKVWVTNKKWGNHRKQHRIVAQQQQQEEGLLEKEREPKQEEGVPQQQQQQQQPRTAQQLPQQPMARSKNMSREYGGQWLSSVTRHVRIYAAYIDPVTHAFDQTQMDKLTLMLDTTNEFVWTPDACQKVYAYFQELVDHYEGAPLSEYTLRLIGSDIEHYIRKLLYDGEIKYNMNARVLNFSMGKPRVKFNSSQIQDV